MVNKLELLNSEGPILTAIKTRENSFSVIDQYKETVAKTKQQILEFVSGVSSITDSMGKQWWYLEQSEGMRPNTTEKILGFLNG